MTMIRIYGAKGSMIAKPFVINSVDLITEDNSEEEEIINSSASETDNTESAKVGEQTGN